MSLLDTVEPDAFIRLRYGGGLIATKKSHEFEPDVAHYSRHKVESLLAENRKQVLLEVIAEWEKPFVIEPEKFIDRLRRMAEGEKE